MLENFRSGEWQVGKIFQFKQILALILHKCAVNHFIFMYNASYCTIYTVLTGVRGKMSLKQKLINFALSGVICVLM